MSKRWKRPILIAVICLVECGIGIALFHSPLIKSLDSVMSEEVRLAPAMSGPLTNLANIRASQDVAMSMLGSKWLFIEDSMISQGTSRDGASEVLSVVRRHILATHAAGNKIYGAPCKAERSWVGIRPVWIVDIRWGSIGDGSPDSSPRPLTNAMVLAIDTRRPHKVLGVKTLEQSLSHSKSNGRLNICSYESD